MVSHSPMSSEEERGRKNSREGGGGARQEARETRGAWGRIAGTRRRSDKKLEEAMGSYPRGSLGSSRKPGREVGGWEAGG